MPMILFLLWLRMLMPMHGLHFGMLLCMPMTMAVSVASRLYFIELWASMTMTMSMSMASFSFIFLRISMTVTMCFHDKLVISKLSLCPI